MRMIGLFLGVLIAAVSLGHAGSADWWTNISANFNPTNHWRQTVSNATTMAIPPIPVSTSANSNIPLIQFTNVPLSDAIYTLAGQAGIQNIMASDFNFETNGVLCEPEISCRWQNITAMEALQRILDHYQLYLIEDTATSVWRLTRHPKPVDYGPARAFGLYPTRAPGSTNGVIPIIQLNDVSLNVTLTNLVWAANQLPSSTNPVVMLDPRLQATQTDNADQNEEEEQPRLTLCWRNLTAAQALVALCETYHLDAIKDRDTGIIHIKPHPAAHRLWHQRRQ